MSLCINVRTACAEHEKEYCTPLKLNIVPFRVGLFTASELFMWRVFNSVRTYKPILIGMVGSM